MLRPSVMRASKFWVAVHRNERDKIVWSCGHQHKNRDASTRASGMSALDCALGCTPENLSAVIARREEEQALLAGKA